MSHTAPKKHHPLGQRNMNYFAAQAPSFGMIQSAVTRCTHKTLNLRRSVQSATTLSARRWLPATSARCHAKAVGDWFPFFSVDVNSAIAIRSLTLDKENFKSVLPFRFWSRTKKKEGVKNCLDRGRTCEYDTQLHRPGGTCGAL